MQSANAKDAMGRARLLAAACVGMMSSAVSFRDTPVQREGAGPDSIRLVLVMDFGLSRLALAPE